MIGKKTVDALLSLRPSGPQSFEDLLRELLVELTGQPYYLCASGWQGGIDAVDEEGLIGFEAKLYGEKGPDLRPLLGEIDQATRERPRLMLWILATSGRLAAQDRQQLADSAAQHGIALLLLAEGAGSEPFHPVAGLCAALPERVCAILEDPVWRQEGRGRRRKEEPFSLAEVRAELAALAGSPQFDSFRARLVEKLRELPTWRMFVERHNQRVKRAIRQTSKVAFGTHFEPERVIPRTIRGEVDRWQAAALSSHEPPLGVVLGERFDGKTWMVFEWLLERIDTLNLPVFFLGSIQGDRLDRLDQMLVSEVKRSLGPYQRHAETLLDRHRRRAAGRTPWCLLILDGLNEYKDQEKPWRRHLTDAYARGESESRPAAVLCTVRARSWPDIEQDVRRSVGVGVQPLAVHGFDDREFAEALRRAGKAQEDIASLPESVQELIRRPRFFQLVLDHSDRLGRFEVVNEDVLYWLDVSDKLRRDRPGVPARWTEDDYQGVLLDLARRSIERHGLKRREVLDSLEAQARSEAEVGFEELMSEGVLSKSGIKYTLHPEHLRTGMGLYLLDLLDRPEEDQDQLRERLRDMLAPYNDDDTAGAWLRRASVFALLSGRSSKDAMDVLVDEWLRSRNRPPDDLQQLRPIAPLLVHTLLRLAPRTWTRATRHRGLQELSILLFSESIERERSLIQSHVRRWCRFVPSRGPSLMEDEPNVEERVRTALQDPGLASLGLTARGDSGLLQLQNVVLYLESLSPGLLGPDDLLTIVAAHHIPLYFFSNAGPWILRRAMAEVPREWFERWIQPASRNRSSLLARIVHNLLQLVERADLNDLLSLVWSEPAEQQEVPDLQEEGRSLWLLERERHRVVDPSSPLPPAERLDQIRQRWRETFGDVRLQLSSSSAREDHLFLDSIAVVAAWMPEEGAEVVRRQIEDLPRRFEHPSSRIPRLEDQHWWVLSIRRHAVLAAGPARDHLAAAAGIACSGNSCVAPGYALLTLLPGMPPADAVYAIFHHRLEIEWGVLYELASHLNVSALREACLAALEQAAGPQQRIRFYCLLSELGAPSCLPRSLLPILRRDVEEGDAELRAAALGCAVACEVPDLPPHTLLKIALDREYRKTLAPRYAAWLLAQDGHFLDRLPPYWRAVAAAIHPARNEQLLHEVEEALGATTDRKGEELAFSASYILPVRYDLKPSRGRLSVRAKDSSLHFVREDSTLGGLEEDGLKPEEMAAFFNQDLWIEKLNRQMQEGGEILHRRQEEHQTAWSYEQFPQELVDRFDKPRFEHWVEALLRDPRQTWFRWIGLVMPMFRRALRQGDEAAVRLWDLVHPFPRHRGPGIMRYVDRGIDWVLHELSLPCANDALARQFLRNLVLDVRTDRQLFDLTLGARCQGQVRLAALAEEFLDSSSAEDRARAARLLGWLKGTEDRLLELSEADPSLWVRQIAQVSMETRQRERFARHWLETFLRQDLTREKRWGAAQLFLESVDGCFEAWAFGLVREAAPDDRARGEAILLLHAAREEVKQDRSRDLEKHFLGTKVSDLESGCHPWQRQRSWHELKRAF